LRRSGIHLNRERFIDAIESITGFDVGIDSTLTFSATDHQGFDRVYFTRIKNGKLVSMNLKKRPQTWE